MDIDLTVPQDFSDVGVGKMARLNEENDVSIHGENFDAHHVPYGLCGVGADPDDESDPIPRRFINGVKGDLVEARKRWQFTKAWRRNEHIDAILDEPQPNFAMIKKYYPHGFHKISKEGDYLYFEIPSSSNITKIWKAGLTMEDLLRHYIFVTEFMWRKVDKREDGMVVSIFDVGNSSMSDLAGNTLKLFQKCSEIIGSHYPERSKSMYILRAPWWFQTGFAIVSPFIDPRTKKKINVLGNSKTFSKVLQDVFDPANLPIQFGGADTTPLGDSDIEREMREYVRDLNSRCNVPNDAEYCMPGYRNRLNESLYQSVP